jgi:hypothetical protein
MKYVLYEGKDGAMLFTKEESIKSNPSLLAQFENKSPTLTIEASDDGAAVAELNTLLLIRNQEKKS